MTLLNNCSNSLVNCISRSHGLKYIFKMKIFLFETTMPRVLIFCMYHNLVDLHQVCSNYSHVVLMAHSWRWHILHRYVITCWERADLLALLCVVFSCILSLSHMVSRVSCGTWLYRFLVFALCFTFILGKHNQIFLPETTMPSTLIFSMQHHLVRLYLFNSIWGTGTIKWTRLRAHTFTIGIYWENVLVWHHKAYNIDICYVASPSIPLLSLFT